MVKHKITSAFGLFLILLLIAGCGSFGGGKDGPPVSAEFTATGTEGIVMNFIQDQPPAKVYTQSPLTFLVEIRNRGTASVQSAAFYLTGFDPNMVAGLPPAYIITQQLDGKNQFNPEGGYTTAEFSTSSVNLPVGMPNYKPTFMLTACYPYKTLANPLICVDPNPIDTTSDKACRVQKVYSTGSQGAPVAVQSVEAEARPSGSSGGGSMYFRIHIANMAGGTEGASGTVFDQASLQACPGGLQYSQLNTVDYMVTIGGAQQPLECEPQGKIRLVNNQATIFCKYMNIPNMAAYQTPLNIELRYGYKNSIAKMVEIENLNFAR